MRLVTALALTVSILLATGVSADLEARVRQFLERHRGTWQDMNVPAADGQKLHDLIVEHKYKNALEIGTSTGHSGIWIALALSKTGGKLLTIEIDEDRHAEALANFRQAGVAPYIDARLADAHQLVPALNGPFDFVFCDADKDWYGKYFTAAFPKLTVGGCFVAHNISQRGWGGGFSRDFLQLVRGYPNVATTLFNGGAGMSISCKNSL